MYNKIEQGIIWLSAFEFISHKKEELILSIFNDAADMFANFGGKQPEIEKIVDGMNLDKMLFANNDEFLKNYILRLEQMDVKIITIFSKGYPEKLKEVDSPPYILFCKGDTSLLNSDSIAIVGTRQPTTYGRGVTANFSKCLAENGFTIVSGLAYGVDTIAHESALEVDGKTIAVLAGGFNYIYPASNSNLSETISKKGLLVSEYKPSTQPSTYTFPIRNRIIAGLCKGTLITEAGERSGSLHTKEYALECGRDIFVVPGNINSSASAGTNRLIKSCQSACVTSFEDILSYYGKEKIDKQKKEIKQLSFDEDLIFGLLKDRDMTFEEICEKTSIETKKVNSYLTTLQIRGIIRKSQGNIFSIN
ncbi:MAG: DNA-processing protein DprA [Clostridia bacterium]